MGFEEPRGPHRPDVLDALEIEDQLLGAAGRDRLGTVDRHLAATARALTGAGEASA